MSTQRTELQKSLDRDIGRRLKEFRELNKISQKEIADLWKVKANSMAGYESGKVSIKPLFLKLLKDRYNLPEEFFADESIHETIDIFDIGRVSVVARSEEKKELLSNQEIMSKLALTNENLVRQHGGMEGRHCKTIVKL